MTLKIKCTYCDVEISKNNMNVHVATQKHQNNVDLKEGKNIEVEKLKKLISILVNDNLKLKFDMNTLRLQLEENQVK